jgi:hypothetical protein
MFPPFVCTAAQRLRWYLAVRVAEEVSALYEPDGAPDRRFVLSASRSLYFSPIPTTLPLDLPADPELALLEIATSEVRPSALAAAEAV